MCGRFAVATTKAEIGNAFAVKHWRGQHHLPSYNVVPGVAITTVRSAKDGIEAAPVYWGWKNRSGKFFVNLRSENAVRRGYEKMLTYGRCVAPATGFFEWRREGRINQPYHIATAQPTVGLAAIWKDTPEGEACVILTVDAAPAIARLHTRMPIMLTRAQTEQWLQPDAPIATLHALLQLNAQQAFHIYPVSPKINRGIWNAPECLHEITLATAHAQQLKLF